MLVQDSNSGNSCFLAIRVVYHLRLCRLFVLGVGGTPVSCHRQVLKSDGERAAGILKTAPASWFGIALETHGKPCKGSPHASSVREQRPP